MLKLRSLSRLDWVSTGLILAALVVALAPPPTRDVPRLTASGESDSADAFATLAIDYIAEKFDLSALPAPKIVKPALAPVDPRASLRGYTLLGVTMTGARSIALIANGSERSSVLAGDTIGGFEVTAIAPRRIDLQKGAIRATLSLPD